jgi:hypothetical protein
MTEDTKPGDAAAGEDGAARGPEKKSKRRKQWGEETEAGLQVLNELQTETNQDDAAEGPAAKKRRSRWEPQTKTTIVPGLEIALPASLAHLADLNPEVLELQRRLTNVGARAGRPCTIATALMPALRVAERPSRPAGQPEAAADPLWQLRGRHARGAALPVARAGVQRARPASQHARPARQGQADARAHGAPRHLMPWACRALHTAHHPASWTRRVADPPGPLWSRTRPTPPHPPWHHRRLPATLPAPAGHHYGAHQEEPQLQAARRLPTREEVPPHPHPAGRVPRLQLHRPHHRPQVHVLAGQPARPAGQPASPASCARRGWQGARVLRAPPSPAATPASAAQEQALALQGPCPRLALGAARLSWCAGVAAGAPPPTRRRPRAAPAGATPRSAWSARRAPRSPSGARGR